MILRDWRPYVSGGMRRQAHHAPGSKVGAGDAGGLCCGRASEPSDQETPPFKFLSDVMNDEGNELSVRVDAAKALMP
jgi:hypothetical protein